MPKKFEDVLSETMAQYTPAKQAELREQMETGRQPEEVPTELWTEWQKNKGNSSGISSSEAARRYRKNL